MSDRKQEETKQEEVVDKKAIELLYKYERLLKFTGREIVADISTEIEEFTSVTIEGKYEHMTIDYEDAIKFAEWLLNGYKALTSEQKIVQEKHQCQKKQNRKKKQKTQNKKK